MCFYLFILVLTFNLCWRALSKFYLCVSVKKWITIGWWCKVYAWLCAGPAGLGREGRVIWPALLFRGSRPTCPGWARHIGLISAVLLRLSVLTSQSSAADCTVKPRNKTHVKLHTVVTLRHQVRASGAILDSSVFAKGYAHFSCN